MKKLIIIFLAFSSIVICAQEKKTVPSPAGPKLVVGIIVDQMRNDYISRYWDRFSQGGFKRLVTEGYYFKNAHYNYIPTYTGPGHASVYTGTTPRIHGIIGNDWYLRQTNGWTNCITDESVKTVGSESKAGQASPRQLLSTTVTDELKLNNSRSKVFALSIKDRSAIFPAGHAGDAAFWFDDLTGNFISSTFYVKELPAWLNQFNEKRKAKTYLQKGWNTLYPIASYTSSIADNNRYESAPFKESPVFPYDFRAQLESNQLGIIKATPYGNSILKDAAIECIQAELLGKDEIPDFLGLSFSSTDIIGHSFGPRSVEIEDVYLRLDKDLEEIMTALDQLVGKNNYSIFLTADHGAAEVPNHLLDEQIPAGNLNMKDFVQKVKFFFQSNYGDSLLLANISNEQVFLQEQKIIEMKLNRQEVEERLCRFLENTQGIAEAYPSRRISEGSFEDTDQRQLLLNGYNRKLSGNVCYLFQPGWMDLGDKGTTHGTGYSYDTHVPVIFYGWGVKKGENYSRITITQIAPTVSELLKCNYPSGTSADPLNNHFK
jgi:predicted AlkP superfamily pyrophosphatase or phosphodiesterase